VEIAWPDQASARTRLFDLFRTCLGMRIALIDESGLLYAAEGAPGRPWSPNLDRYSGFVRQPNGRMTAAEHGTIRALSARHGGLRAARPVRIFPRRVDAFLLGGLSQLIGPGYRMVQTIQAQYRLRGQSVRIAQIKADGRRVGGQIDLTAVAVRACR
jgi:hypothetical protein